MFFHWVSAEEASAEEASTEEVLLKRFLWKRCCGRGSAEEVSWKRLKAELSVALTRN